MGPRNPILNVHFVLQLHWSTSPLPAVVLERRRTTNRRPACRTVRARRCSPAHWSSTRNRPSMERSPTPNSSLQCISPTIALGIPRSWTPYLSDSRPRRSRHASATLCLSTRLRHRCCGRTHLHLVVHSSTPSSHLVSHKAADPPRWKGMLAS